jgi:hypothetical protein
MSDEDAYAEMGADDLRDALRQKESNLSTQIENRKKI